MSINVNYEFLFVGRDENSFLENYVYDAVDELGDKGGRLWVTLEIQNNPAEAESIAEAVFETMRNNFFKDIEKDSYARFEDSLKEANKVLESFKAGKSSHYIGNVSILTAAVANNELFLSQCGEAEAYLIRKKYVSVITEGLSDDNYEFFTNIANGALELNDFIVLCSSRLLRYISKTELAKSITASDVVKSLEELKGAISSEILGKVGIVGIGVSEEKEVIEEEVIRPSFIASKLEFLNKIPFLKSFKLDKLDDYFNKIDFEKLKSRTSDALKKAREIRSRFVRPDSYKDKILAGFIIVILILAAFIGITKYRQSRSQELLALDTKLNTARDEISEALTKGQYDKAAAGVILAHSEETAKEILNTDMRAKATEVLAQIQETRDSLDNAKRISSPEVFLDLSKNKAGINALGILQLKDRTYVFDDTSLIEIILDKVGNPVNIAADNETVIAGTVFDDMESLVFLTKSGKLIEYKDGNFRYLSTLDGTFHKGIAIKSWGNRIYILNPEEDQIWRYPFMKTKDMFSNSEAYRRDGDMKNAVDFALDGNIYVAGKDGSLQRYYNGNLQQTPILKTPFRSPASASKVYTDGDMMQVFVLDGSENRFYIYQKEQKGAALSYNRQYQVDNIGEIRSFYFDKTANQIYLLDQKKIYKLTL